MHGENPILGRIIFMTIFFGILFLMEWYIYNGLKSIMVNHPRAKLWWRLYLGFGAFSILGTAFFMLNMASRTPGTLQSPVMNFVGGLAVTLFVTKLLLVVIFSMEDVYRILRIGFDWMASFFSSDSADVSMESRRKFVAQVGLGVASIPFASFLYGITWGKSNYKVEKVKLKFPDLPSAFDGYRIVQISDFHAGSFDNVSDVQYGLDLIAKQNPDMVVFTGDMVNNLADEVLPFKEMWSKVSAPDGKFSIMGNHDYGDYVGWNDESERKENITKLHTHQKDMGFRLLLNENLRIERDGQAVVLAGVENWGKPPMAAYGDLNKTLEGIDSEEFTVLLSHDPSHWDGEIRGHKKKVHLTLSGHTHGMQMGVNIPGFKWSPVQWRYKQWAGTYRNGEEHLYVNRGFGFIGLPGRVGMWPEVTVIELERA